jgi:hypothetical protein
VVLGLDGSSKAGRLEAGMVGLVAAMCSSLKTEVEVFLFVGEGGSLAAVCTAVEVVVAVARWVQGGWELGLMCGLIARRWWRVVLVMARWLRRW